MTEAKGSILNANQPDLGRKRDFRVISESDTLGGGAQTKTRVTLRDLQEDENTPISMIKRISWNGAYNFYHTWRRFTQAGIPTAKEVYVLDKNELLVSDETTDGSILVSYNHLFFMARPYDQLFDKIKDNPLYHYVEGLNPKLVTNMCSKIAEAASADDILLPEDAFQIKIRPGGKWDIICIDLDNSLLDATQSGDKYFSTLQKLAKANRSRVFYMNKFLNEAQKRFRDEGYRSPAPPVIFSK
jgi:hypothetical protein